MATLRFRRRHAGKYYENVEKGRNLVSASKIGDENEVRRLLLDKVSVDAEEFNRSLFYASENYVTPLQVATAYGHDACLRLLIEHRAELNARDRFDVTAVHMAAEFDHYECLKLLLDAGAECSVPTKYSKKGCYTAHPHVGGTTALHLAAANNHIECVCELIQFGADYNAVDEKGRTSLYIAAENGFEDCVLAHLHNAIGRDILSLPSHETGDTPLHFSVMHGMVKGVAKLLEHGSDVNLRNCAGYSPLHYSVLMNYNREEVALEILKLLVLRGFNCDINLPDFSGQTILHQVVFNEGIRSMRRPLLAKFLIAYGAEINIFNQRGYNLIQGEMRSSSDDLTILSSIAKSSLRLPPLASLNLPPLLPPQRRPPPDPSADYSFENLLGPPFAPSPPPHQQIQELELYYGQRRLQLLSNGNRFRQQEDSEEEMIGDPPRLTRKTHRLKLKYDWYKSLTATPRSLQHYCRYTIRKSLTYKRLRHLKDLPLPTALHNYLLLEYDEYK